MKLTVKDFDRLTVGFLRASSRTTSRLRHRPSNELTSTELERRS